MYQRKCVYGWREVGGGRREEERSKGEGRDGKVENQNEGVRRGERGRGREGKKRGERMEEEREREARERMEEGIRGE